MPVASPLAVIVGDGMPVSVRHGTEISMSIRRVTGCSAATAASALRSLAWRHSQTWRAVGAQRLAQRAEELMERANEALARSREAESKHIRMPAEVVLNSFSFSFASFPSRSQSPLFHEQFDSQNKDSKRIKKSSF